jgi:hypothetical protein
MEKDWKKGSCRERKKEADWGEKEREGKEIEKGRKKGSCKERKERQKWRKKSRGEAEVGKKKIG